MQVSADCAEQVALKQQCLHIMSSYSLKVRSKHTVRLIVLAVVHARHRLLDTVKYMSLRPLLLVLPRL
ncbi:MAG: hypothetical protein U0T77_04975 [Chitinophagales bacterium]